MSETPPDRKEEAGAPDGPRNPWVGWLVCAILVPVLYVLSIGPVNWLVEKHHLPEAALIIYLPLDALPKHILDIIIGYRKLWVP